MGNKFSDKNMGQNSLRQKAKDMATRVGDLEVGLAQTLVGVDNKFQNTNNNLNALSEVVNVLCEEFGFERIMGMVEQKRHEREEAQAAVELKSLEEAIADGYVTASEVIEENSIIIGQEVLPDGKLLATGRQQVAFRSLDPKYQEQLLGKGRGEVVKTPLGGTFEVKEVYIVDSEKGRAVLAEKARVQAEASQLAAQAAAEVDEKSDVETKYDSAENQ